MTFAVVLHRGVVRACSVPCHTTAAFAGSANNSGHWCLQDDAVDEGQPLDLPEMPWDWRIQPEQLEFKRRPDGSLWELGGGAYGRVSFL